MSQSCHRTCPAVFSRVRPNLLTWYPQMLSRLELTQRPWIVQLLSGPVTGSTSQNWVCRKSPPGELKQQVSVSAALAVELLEQENGADALQVAAAASKTFACGT